MKEFRIKKNEAGQRFDKYLGKLLPGAPKSFLYRMLRKKIIVLKNALRAFFVIMFIIKTNLIIIKVISEKNSIAKEKKIKMENVFLLKLVMENMMRMNIKKIMKTQKKKKKLKRKKLKMMMKLKKLKKKLKIFFLLLKRSDVDNVKILKVIFAILRNANIFYV